MTTALILDLIVLVILALFVWRGAVKGFVLSLCGLVALLVGFVGAAFLARTFAPMVAGVLEPTLSGLIRDGLAAAGSGEGSALSDVLAVLGNMGLSEELLASLTESAAGAATAAVDAAAAAISQTIAYAVLFIVGLVAVLIVWAIISHALDLVAKLPVLNSLNKTGGALIGAVKGCLLLFLVGWLLHFSGKVIPAETVQQTWLLRFFMTNTPLSLLASL